jgi:hypothetical protein
MGWDAVGDRLHGNNITAVPHYDLAHACHHARVVVSGALSISVPMNLPIHPPTLPQVNAVPEHASSQLHTLHMRFLCVATTLIALVCVWCA